MRLMPSVMSLGLAFLISAFVWLGWHMVAIAADDFNLWMSLSADRQVSALPVIPLEMRMPPRPAR